MPRALGLVPRRTLPWLSAQLSVFSIRRRVVSLPVCAVFPLLQCWIQPPPARRQAQPPPGRRRLNRHPQAPGSTATRQGPLNRPPGKAPGSPPAPPKAGGAHTVVCSLSSLRTEVVRSQLLPPRSAGLYIDLIIVFYSLHYRTPYLGIRRTRAVLCVPASVTLPESWKFLVRPEPSHLAAFYQPLFLRSISHTPPSIYLTLAPFRSGSTASRTTISSTALPSLLHIHQASLTLPIKHNFLFPRNSLFPLHSLYLGSQLLHSTHTTLLIPIQRIFSSSLYLSHSQLHPPSTHHPPPSILSTPPPYLSTLFPHTPHPTLAPPLPPSLPPFHLTPHLLPYLPHLTPSSIPLPLLTLYPSSSFPSLNHLPTHSSPPRYPHAPLPILSPPYPTLPPITLPHNHILLHF